MPIPAEELNEALRRALVVRAVGGSPQREVTLEEDAVLRLAEELDVAGASGGAVARASRRCAKASDVGASASLERLLADDDSRVALLRGRIVSRPRLVRYRLQ